MNILYVALGSALGGVCRYGLSHVVNERWSGMFPLGTFIVNVLGCFVIGLLYGFIDRGMNLSQAARLFLITGFCGGFTTFSTFAHENYLLFGAGAKGVLLVSAYAASSFFAGLIAVYLGHRLSEVL